MASDWGEISLAHGDGTEHRSSRREMGAAERRHWSSFIRQDLVAQAVEHLAERHTHGVVVLGPRGVGKTTLARAVEDRIAGTTHFVKLFGSGTQTSIPYGLWGVHLARLDGSGPQNPNSIISGIAELVHSDAAGHQVVVVLDNLQIIDTASMGVLMHLVFSGVAKVLVLARTSNELPEDLMWLFKDGLLAELVLDNFSKAEVQELITKALGGFVAAATVAALYESSGGNPLVLHTLIHEEIQRGQLVQHNETWVLTSERSAAPSRLLAELVQERLERESEQVRHGVKMMALIQRVPLSMVLDVLGADTVAQMEESNYLLISQKTGLYTSLAEPFIGETVRSMMGREEKARLYRELTDTVSLEAQNLSRQELLVFATWAHDAGVRLETEVALSAARTALLYSDPQLALKFSTCVQARTAQAVRAAMVRSAAYSLLANYPQAVAELLESQELAQETLDVAEHATWVAELCGALLWVDGGAAQIPELLGAEHARVDAGGANPELVAEARRSLKLAQLEYQVHNGMFTETAPSLESGYRDMEDADCRHFCGSLLVLVWAATGRELDAVELAREIDANQDGTSRFVRQPNLHLHGMVLALTWSGQWQQGAQILMETIVSMPRSEYHGGIIELGLGIAYVSAGKGKEATDILLVAVAQLELRDTYNHSQLAYSALAYALAQAENDVEAAKYLALASSLEPNTGWVSLAMAKFFTLMTQIWMGDPEAALALAASAQEDIAAGRYTFASLSLFGASVSSREKDLQLLESAAAMRQGPMAEVSLLLAQAALSKDAQKALTAASVAEDLDLAAVELRCALLALELARAEGYTRQAKEAEQRIDRLTPSSPAMALLPATEGVKLTQRELQVAKLAGRGMANRAIAERMGVSIRTVEGHLYQVFSKLGLSSRNELLNVGEPS